MTTVAVLTPTAEGVNVIAIVVLPPAATEAVGWAVMTKSLACAPMSLGSRCVPPAPGNSPSCTSGRPRDVLGLSVARR